MRAKLQNAVFVLATGSTEYTITFRADMSILAVRSQPGLDDIVMRFRNEQPKRGRVRLRPYKPCVTHCQQIASLLDREALSPKTVN